MEEQAKDSTLQSRLAATADPQLSSPFFSVLPPEVRRMIYAEVWRHNQLHSDARDQTGQRCLKQHIVKQKAGGYTHSPCVVSDQTAPDFRSQRLAVFPQPCLRSDIWTDRIESDWAVHWPCEEMYKKHASRRRRSTFMAALLTCKLMYLECRESIYSSLTFVFTDTITAESFISLFPSETFRSLELAIRIPTVLTKLYLPDLTSERSLRNSPLDSQNNPWAKLCSTLSEHCTDLRRLSLWFDTKHLDGWTDRVCERLFFADLWGVRVVRGSVEGGGFVLALPELNRSQMKGRRETSEVGDSYLVGEALEGAPFRVVRGARPNYWEAHFARFSASQDVLTIDAGPGA